MGNGDPGGGAQLGQGDRLGWSILQVGAGALDGRHPLWRDDSLAMAQHDLLQPLSYPPQELVARNTALTAVAQELAKVGGRRWIGNNRPTEPASLGTA
jgi:hypothetical protein